MPLKEKKWLLFLDSTDIFLSKTHYLYIYIYMYIYLIILQCKFDGHMLFYLNNVIDNCTTQKLSKGFNHNYNQIQSLCH